MRKSEKRTEIEDVMAHGLYFASLEIRNEPDKDLVRERQVL